MEQVAHVFNDLTARRISAETSDGTQLMLGITVSVMLHHHGSARGPERLPEILVPLRTALDLPQAIQSALARNFSSEEAQQAAGDHSPSGMTPSDH